MLANKQGKVIESNYNLKFSNNKLIKEGFTSADLTLEKLEAIRRANDSLSSSKYGLEVICGLSCETGAL